MRLAAITRAHHQTSADSPPATRLVICQPPSAHPRSSYLSYLPESGRIHSTVQCLREGRAFHKLAVIANTRFTCMNALGRYTASNYDVSVSLFQSHHLLSLRSIWQIPTGAPHVLCSKQPPEAQGKIQEAKGPRPEGFAAKRLRQSR